MRSPEGFGAARPATGQSSHDDNDDGSDRSRRTTGRAAAGALLVFVVPALWSVNYLIARWAPGVIAPHALALGRWIVATLLLAGCCWPELLAKRGRIRAEWTHFLVLGALGMWICGAFVYIGGRSTSAVNLGLLYGAAPVLIALGSALWLRERLGPVQVCSAS